jgi:hypothetical protein
LVSLLCSSPSNKTKDELLDKTLCSLRFLEGHFKRRHCKVAFLCCDFHFQT